VRIQDPRAALAYQIAWSITEKKIERDDENAADRLGLFAAAEAGYHPDYGILAARVMRLSNPDGSKFMTFFNSDHPRWITREEHTEKNYSAALASFDRKWPDTQTSPGGIPPTVAIVSRVQIAKSRAGIAVSTQVQIHNIRGQKSTLSARVLEQGQPQQIAFTRQYAVDQTAPDSISFEIPKSRLQSPKKASLLFEVISGDETLYNSGPIALGSSHKTNNESKTVVASTSHAANQALILAHVAKKGEKPEEGLVPDDQNSFVT
jgi:hypothetical protein